MRFEPLSARAAAKTLGVSLITLRRWIADRKLAHYRLGRRVVLSAEDVAAYLAAHRVPPREPVRLRRRRRAAEEES